jgi:hypothetical protein
MGSTPGRAVLEDKRRFRPSQLRDDLGILAKRIRFCASTSLLK